MAQSKVYKCKKCNVTIPTALNEAGQLEASASTCPSCGCVEIVQIIQEAAVDNRVLLND
jgi:hypothetical protein